MASKSSAVDATPIAAASKGFDGGLNLRDTIPQLAPNELANSENGVLDEKGGWSKRLGCRSNGTFGASGDRLLSAYTFYRGTAGNPQVLIHTTAGTLYYTNDATANPIVWTQIATGLSTTARLSFETFLSKVWFTNGVDVFASWDGAAYTTYASAPKGKFVRLWKDTLWISGVTGLDDRLYSSAAGDPTTWPATSWVDITKGDGDTTTCLGTDGLVLIFGKRNRIMTVYDPGTFANRVIDYEKGIESHFSMIQFENEIYFLTRRGIAKFDSSGPSVILSAKLDPLFDPNILNLAALSTTYSYVFNNQVGFAVPEAGSAYPTLQIEYYPRLAPYSQLGSRLIGPFALQRMPASVFARVRVGQTETLYGGHNTANKFLQLFAPVGTDDGATFAAIMRTGPYDFGVPTRTKYIRRFKLIGRGAMNAKIIRNLGTGTYRYKYIDLTQATDLWSLTQLWGQGNWGPGSVVKEARWIPDAYARFFQFQFDDSSANTGQRIIDVGSREFQLTAGEWSIYSFAMEGSLLGFRD